LICSSSDLQPKAWFNEHLLKGSGDLLVPVVGLLLVFWFANFLYRKKIFLRP